MSFRKTYEASLLAIHRDEDTLSRMSTEDHEPTAVGKVPFKVGDTLVIHSTWESLTRLTKDRDFVVVTQDFPREELRPRKLGFAVLFFLIALTMILFTDVRLSLCLFTGAVGMILTGVLDIDEAYEAVNWTSVFLLASLIPLGMAVQNTGTAEWIAHQVLAFAGWLAFMGAANWCRGLGHHIHTRDVKCWCDGAFGATRRVDRDCSGW